MAFCEQCGAKLTAGARFCEECGTPVPEDAMTGAAFPPTDKSENISFDVFKGASWRVEWLMAAEEAHGEELGIIITSEDRLASQLDVGKDALRRTIADYIACAARRGVHYHYLDLEDNAIETVDGSDVADVVSLLREIVDVARPKYLFILGNEEIIDVATWENEARDGDDDVYSDLPYSTLDTTSPWEGQDFNGSEALRVGRLPTTEGHFDDFQAYLWNAANGVGAIDRIAPYGLSAPIWKEEANTEYLAISKSPVDTCPNVTIEDVGERIGSAHANLMFFNLHGSDETEFWYGQKGKNYPEALSPEVFVGYPHCFFLGVEACYGARFIELEPEESIVKTAIANRCLAFLGSSKIAYGTSKPKGACADIVIGEFIRHIADGDTAGDAHIAGLEELTSKAEMDDSDIKTLAEFALYGDPSACTGRNKNVGAMKGMLTRLGGVPKGIRIPMPDVRKAAKMYLAQVSSNIERAIDDFVAENLLPAIKTPGVNLDAKTFRMRNSDLNQKMYTLKGERIRQVAKVYFDDNGKIHKAILSK